MNPVTLRPYTDEDHLNTYSWLQAEDLRRCTGTSVAPTAQSHHDWLHRMRSRPDVAMFAVCEGQRHAGNLYLVNLDTSNLHAEVQIYLGAEQSRGHGIGTRALEAVKQIAFSEMKLERLYAFVFAFNTRALTAFQKAGFLLEGTLRRHRRRGGRFLDVHIVGSVKDHGQDIDIGGRPTAGSADRAG